MKTNTLTYLRTHLSIHIVLFALVINSVVSVKFICTYLYFAVTELGLTFYSYSLLSSCQFEELPPKNKNKKKYSGTLEKPSIKRHSCHNRGQCGTGSCYKKHPWEGATLLCCVTPLSHSQQRLYPPVRLQCQTRLFLLQLENSHQKNYSYLQTKILYRKRKAV